MRLRTKLLYGALCLLTGALAAQAQVPGVNSALQSVFTLAYDNSTMKPTYSATTPVFTLASAATDVCSLQGSATKRVKIRRIIVGGAATAVASDPAEIIKRSTAGTGGTQVLDTMVPYDASSAAATALAEHFTANVTVGTVVGVIQTQWLTFANLTTGVGTPVVFTFGELGQPLVLRSAAQNVTVNLNGATFAGGVLTCTFEWTEDTD